jgi:hypothetical protein
MPFTTFLTDICPKCRKPKMRATLDLHPSNSDLAVETFECAKCGPVKTKLISLKPSMPKSELPAANVIAQ